MRQPAPLVLRVGVIASSLLLVTGFIGYRAGYLFSGPSVLPVVSQPMSSSKSAVISVQEPASKSVYLNSIDAGLVGQPPDAGQAQSPLNGSSKDIQLASHELQVVNPAGAPENGNHFVTLIESAQQVSTPTVFSSGLVVIPTDQLDALRRTPGKTSMILIEHDAISQHMQTMSSSKSIVIAPQEPVSKKQRIDAYLVAVNQAFMKRDLNHDRKLTDDELGHYNWKHFVSMGAVENGAVDFDGFLKNYLWYANQK